MLKIAIVSGGDSGEYEVSIKSGKQVELNLDRSRFEPYLIEIQGDRWVHLKDGMEFPVDKNDFGLNTGAGKITFDAVFNAIHGTPGENGKLQGYLDMLGIPYTSCDVATSALTFNKSFCKNVVSSYGIFNSNSVHLFKGENEVHEKICKHLKLPVFIKPNNGGSSVGMSKIMNWDELEGALNKAFDEDDQVLAEEFIAGRELTCGVMKSENQIISFPVTEIISKKDFFDYEAKYKEGLAKEVVPANISLELSDECRKISVFLYERLNCKGVVRFDYIHTGDRFCFLEVNTVPGLSEQSIIPKMVIAHGWTIGEFYTRLINECLKIENRK